MSPGVDLPVLVQFVWDLLPVMVVVLWVTQWSLSKRIEHLETRLAAQQYTPEGKR